MNINECEAHTAAEMKISLLPLGHASAMLLLADHDDVCFILWIY